MKTFTFLMIFSSALICCAMKARSVVQANLEKTYVAQASAER